MDFKHLQTHYFGFQTCKILLKLQQRLLWASVTVTVYKQQLAFTINRCVLGVLPGIVNLSNMLTFQIYSVC